MQSGCSFVRGASVLGRWLAYRAYVGIRCDIERKTMAKMKLALVQFQSVLGDVEASMARALPMIDEAAAAGANMVVFPELFTTGYHLDTVGPRMTELAEPIDGPTVRAL